MAFHTFKLDKDNSEYEKPFPKFRMPKVIGFYSKDEKGEVKLDATSKRYIRFKDLDNQMHHKLDKPIDLMYDFERFVSMNEDGAKDVMPLLQWIRENKETVYDEFHHRLEHDFVMSGGTLRRILRAPYIKRCMQVFDIYKVNQTVFVYARRYKVRCPNGEVPEQELILSNIGHKFEVEMTSPTYEGDPDQSDIIYETKRFHYVLSTVINNHKILYSAKVDSVLQVRNPDTDEVEAEDPVELCLVKGSPAVMKNWPFQRLRLLDLWCKSFLAGVKKTIIGFRNDDYIVEELTILKTDSIPNEAVKNKKSFVWSPNVCANFADSLLEFIKSADIKDKKFYEVSVDKEESFSITSIEDSAEQVFPEWYCKEFVEQD